MSRQRPTSRYRRAAQPLDEPGGPARPMQPDATEAFGTGASTPPGRRSTGGCGLRRRPRPPGVRFGDRVLLLTLNSPEVVEAVLAINTLGAIAVPINFRLAPGEVAYIARRRRRRRLCRRRRAAGPGRSRPPGRWPTGHAGAWCRRRPARRTRRRGLIAEDTGGFEAPDVPEDTPALIMYTSGTTGRPKGAMLDHGNLVRPVADDHLGDGHGSTRATSGPCTRSRCSTSPASAASRPASCWATADGAAPARGVRRRGDARRWGRASGPPRVRRADPVAGDLRRAPA